MNKLRRHILLFLLLCSALQWPGTGLYAQMEEKVEELFAIEYEEAEEVELHRFDSTEWMKIVEELSYEEAENPEPIEEEASQRSRTTSDGMGVFLKFLLIALGIGLLGFILYSYFNGHQWAGPKVPIKESEIRAEIEQIEEELPDSELDPILRKAEQSANYRLAIRLRYLKVIQRLAELGYLKWKKEKTNGQYSKELIGTDIQTPFRQLTLVFERLWYGQVSIEPEHYDWAIGQYEEMDQLLRTLKPKEL